LPKDFPDWVTYRLEFEGARHFWKDKIIQRFGDGPESLESFFTLLDEYLDPKPKLVARILSMRSSDGKKLDNSPKELISYNDVNPGLFLVSNSDRSARHTFFPSLTALEAPERSRIADVETIDHAAYDRWTSNLPDYWTYD